MKLQETGVKYICILLLNLVLITGCGTGDGLPHGSNKELVKTGFAFNTTYTITLYAGGSEELLDKCVSKCNGFEKIFSRTLKGS